MQCLKHIPVNKKELDIVRTKNPVPLSRRQFFVTNEVGCKECQAEKESYRKNGQGSLAAVISCPAAALLGVGLSSMETIFEA